MAKVRFGAGFRRFRRWVAGRGDSESISFAQHLGGRCRLPALAGSKQLFTWGREAPAHTIIRISYTDQPNLLYVQLLTHNIIFVAYILCVAFRKREQDSCELQGILFL